MTEFSALMGTAMRDADNHAEYREFLKQKLIRAPQVGIEGRNINPNLFDFQAAIVRWALRKGRCAIFSDCGTGKTFMELEWSKHIATHSGKPVLIFAPLAVSKQTVGEGETFGIGVTLCRTNGDMQPGIDITNYEKLQHFENDIGGLVLDESSILKGFDGKTRALLTAFAQRIPYRLCATATPAPNDYMELGNHAEFLGVMTCTEMLATFFVHDGGETSKWRLKKHAEGLFWKWVCSWAVALRKPSDLGFSDDHDEDGRWRPFELPKLNLHQVTVEHSFQPEGLLFPVEAETLSERRDARRETIDKRVSATAGIVNATTDPFLVWCDLNAESQALTAAIPSAVEITGSDKEDDKESRIIDFIKGRSTVIVSKPSICGLGVNLQHCSKMVFVGLSDSYEQLYQAIRRCWRFGQKREVDCYIVTSESEGAVVRNIERKEKQAIAMMDGMVEHMKDEMRSEVLGAVTTHDTYATDHAEGPGWKMRLGDSVDIAKARESDSVHYSIFSPPFASLYTYSASERDMGNARSMDEFREHFAFLISELYRVLMPGRLLSFHCMNLPATKQFDGFIGIKDFRGALIRMFEDAGFIYHSEVCIWKDPVTAMQRTKAIGLLYKQLRKDSALSRQGIPDYLVTMRKPGVNPQPVTKTHEGYPVGEWQGTASPVWNDIADNYADAVWMDINPSDTLQYRSARQAEDERHICPLQLGVIERAVRLWTNPGDLVLSPFAGIGSEGHVALKMGRTFEGWELKRSYYEQACLNLQRGAEQPDALFTEADTETFE